MSRVRLKDKCVIDIQWHIMWHLFACAYDNVVGSQEKKQPNKCERQENWENFMKMKETAKTCATNRRDLQSISLLIERDP